MLHRATIRKRDDELQIVFAEVYAPNVPDAHGDFMPPEEVRKMAHAFIANGMQGSIDINHDNVVDYGAVVVESFIARPDDPVFWPESWVVGVHIPNVELWEAVKSGEFSGFSMQANVLVEEVEIEVEFPQVVKGYTQPDGSGHVHGFTAYFSDDGRMIGGECEEVDGHSHAIPPLSMTKTATDAGHRHRICLIEGVQIIED